MLIIVGSRKISLEPTHRREGLAQGGDGAEDGVGQCHPLFLASAWQYCRLREVRDRNSPNPSESGIRPGGTRVVQGEWWERRSA